jgi:hypothetical protein
MNTKLIPVSGLLLALLAPGPRAPAQEDRDPENYISMKACVICHKKDETGNQYGKWQEGPHSKAYETLASPEAREVAAKLGIDHPQTSGKCLKCHSTAYHWTEEMKTEKVTVEDGVTCQSCHGPGANYKGKETMSARDTAIAGGLIYPATQSCTLCHNEGNPTWDPERYTTKDGKKVGFDVEQAFEKIKHPRPKE